MEIVGTVISIDGENATVLVKRVSACGENCANCKGACESTKTTAVVKKFSRCMHWRCCKN